MKTNDIKSRGLRNCLLLLLLTAGMLLTSCNKEDNFTHIYGTVTEIGTGKPVEGAKVYLWDFYDFNQSTGQGSYEIIDSAHTASDGRYDFDQAEKYRGSYVTVTAPPGYYNMTRQEFSKIRNGRPLTGDFHVDLPIHPESWIKLRVKNENGISNRIYIVGDNWDWVTPTEEYRSNGLYWKLDATTITIEGDEFDMSFLRRTKGGIDENIFYRVRSVSENFDTLHYPAHDTVYHEIIF